jgi:hypothetical protein
MRRYPKHLGHLACDACGVERNGAADKDSWTIVVRLGVLAETTCPTCAGADGNRPSRELYPVPRSASAGPVELEISDHCVERWRERVRPGLTFKQAEEDLVHQLGVNAHWSQPDWLSHEELGDDTWLMLGDDVGFPVRGKFVVSCFVRGTFNPRGRRLATDVNSFHKRVNRAKERPSKRKYLGREAKRRKRDRRSWREEAS